MINTHLKFEAKIPNGLKVVAVTRNYRKVLSLKANLTLNAKVKVTSFKLVQNLYMINEQFMCKDKITKWSILKFKTNILHV